MKVLAIDPGNEQSAFVVYEPNALEHRGVIWDRGIAPNDVVLRFVRERAHLQADHLAIEMIASYGMAVGREVFDTCVWIGRFIEAWHHEHTRVYRRDVKMHLCGNNTAKDANIRQALIDLFGPGKDKAIGKKGSQGPLYGVAADQWAALAVAVTFTGGGVKAQAA